MTNSARLGLLCGVAMVALTSAAARAEEGVAIKSLLGTIGLISPDKDPIHYRERAPLALPPKAEALPPPSARTAHASDPAWPNDPDVAARRARDAESRIPVTESETRRMNDRPTLSPRELARGRNARRQDDNTPVVRYGDNSKDALLLSPDQLREGTPDSDGPLTDTNPTRRTLVDPPGTMRKSATGRKADYSFEPRRDTFQEQSDPKAYMREQQLRSQE